MYPQQSTQQSVYSTLYFYNSTQKKYMLAAWLNKTKSKLQKQKNYSGGSLGEPVASQIYHITRDFRKKKKLILEKAHFSFSVFLEHSSETNFI